MLYACNAHYISRVIVETSEHNVRKNYNILIEIVKKNNLFAQIFRKHILIKLNFVAKKKKNDFFQFGRVAIKNMFTTGSYCIYLHDSDGYGGRMWVYVTTGRFEYV